MVFRKRLKCLLMSLRIVLIMEILILMMTSKETRETLPPTYQIVTMIE
jgi:hypothetical protein